MTFDSAAPTIYLNLDGALSAGRVVVNDQGATHVDSGRPMFEFARVFSELIRPYVEVQVVLTASWIHLLSPKMISARLPRELIRRVVTCATAVPCPESQAIGGTSDPVFIISHANENSVQTWIALQNKAYDVPRGFEEHFLVSVDDLGIGCPDLRANLCAWMCAACVQARQKRPAECATR
jgi:hypothetical protein